MKQMTRALLTAAVVAVTGAAQAGGDIAAGKTTSATCASCHGASGISNSLVSPHLAGQKDAYLAKQIKAFRDGVRTDPAMNFMVKGLSDTDADNLAAYYSSLKP